MYVTYVCYLAYPVVKGDFDFKSLLKFVYFRMAWIQPKVSSVIYILMAKLRSKTQTLQISKAFLYLNYLFLVFFKPFDLFDVSRLDLCSQAVGSNAVVLAEHQI